MNHWSTSPIGQTNESARQYTPKEDENSSNIDGKARGLDYKCLLATEDLQKIRRSNHSSHRHRHEVMDDEEHEGIIKGLLYPRLEESENDFDFFEEDYDQAQEAVVTAGQAEHTGNSTPMQVESRESAEHAQGPRLQNHYRGVPSSSVVNRYIDFSRDKLNR